MTDKTETADIAQTQAAPRWWSALRPRLTLQSTLIVPYVILTLVLAAGGAYVVTQLVASSLVERLANQISEASRVAADGIVRQERTHLTLLRLMVNTEGLASAMQQQNVEQLVALISPVAHNQQAEIVTVVKRDGRELFTLTRAGDGTYSQQAQGVDFSTLAFVNNVLQSEPDAVGDKFVEILKINGVYYFFTSAPVRDLNEQVVGALLIGTRLEHILADLKREALADMLMLDARGHFITATLPEPDEGYAVFELTPEALPTADNPTTRELILYGRTYRLLYTPLVLREQAVGVLGVILPVNYIVSAVTTSRNQVSLLFVLGTIAVVLLGYGLSRSIVRPIQRLRVVSQAVAAGDLEQRTRLRRTDEIGDLASAFDVMTIKLRERTAEAERLYAETVQRNKELVDINLRLRMAQQQLVQSEKLAAIGQLTAGIVHDVKNPLAVIKGYAEIMLQDERYDAETREWVKNIYEGASKASQIVSDLLKFARQSKMELKERDWRETVEASVRLTEYLARRARIKVIQDLPEQSVIVAYDAQQIEQVTINMIHNAIHAMPNGGTLRLSLKQADHQAALAIQDSGSGIAPENLTRIFDPFFTTKPEGEGTGLGLSMAYGIISDHHGRIDVESKLGEGTTFTIVLPTATPATESDHDA